MGEFKLVSVIHEEHLYRLFCEIGQKIVEDAKMDKLDDDARMLLTLGCEGVLEALSTAPAKSNGMACPECYMFAPVPPSTANIDPPAHSVILAGNATKLCCCRCGHQLAKWDHWGEAWMRTPGKQDVCLEALKLALINQTKMMVCIRDAFHARDALIELIRVLQQNGTLNEEELGDQRHLLEMQMLPERTYRELIAREESVHAALEKLNGESHG